MKDIDENTYSLRKWKAEVYSKAVAKWGMPLQIIMGIEELSELTKELTKYLRNNARSRESLIEEIADVSIMLEQLINMFDCMDEFVIKKCEKFTRLYQLVKREGSI